MVDFKGMLLLVLFWNLFVFCFYIGCYEVSGVFGIFILRVKKEVIVLK